MDRDAKEKGAMGGDSPEETMEFLARSWSLSAQEVSKAVSPTCLVGGANTSTSTILEELSAEFEDASISFSFASSDTSQMVMDRIMSHSDVSPRTSGRLSHSSGPLTESPPLSPSHLNNPKICRSANNFPNQYRAQSSVPAGTTFANVSGKTMGRWLKDRKEKKKEEARTQNAQLHAAISVAGVAAAVAAMAAATASSGSDDQLNKTTVAVASAATLVAAQCVEQAETMGAERDHLASVVSSAVNVRSAGDVMTLTAAAATALRGAATLKARGVKDVWNMAAVIPVERGSCSNGSSNGSLSGEMLAEDNVIGACGRDLLARGCELLKRTRKGDLHWKIVSVYINRSNQVILKMKSRHIAGTITKKKKNIVLEVVKNIPAWPGRLLVEGGENRCYFGLKTVMRGVVEFECLNQREYEIWTQGVTKLLAVSDSRKRKV